MYWSPEPRNKAPGVSGTQGRAPPRFVVRQSTPTSMRSPLQSPPVEPQLPPVLFAFPPKPETPVPVEEKLPKRRRKNKKHRKKKSSEEDLPDFLDKAAKAGLMHKNGYPVQVHHVFTEDDYILEVDRMPYGANGDTPNMRPPVLLIHGIVSSAADFVINHPHQSA
ncbi:hypothetical protein V5799_007017, partial [Amblyomma americanum]